MTPDRSHRLTFPVVLIDDDGSDVSTDSAITWATAYFKKQGYPQVVTIDDSVTPPVTIFGPTAEEMARACFIIEDALETKTK